MCQVEVGRFCFCGFRSFVCRGVSYTRLFGVLGPFVLTSFVPWIPAKVIVGFVWPGGFAIHAG